MLRTGQALLLVGVFAFCWQWCWARVAASVPPWSLRGHSRRRVAWLMANSTHIEIAAAAVTALAIVLLMIP